MKKVFLIILISIGCIGSVLARPQYSILMTYGTKCQSCHINVQGGGARSGPGWLSRKDMGLINPSKIGLGSVFDIVTSTNTWFDGMITAGLDFRYQSAKFSAPSDNEFSVGRKTERGNFIMQAIPYLSIKPVEWLELEAGYNAAYDLEKTHRYTSQQRYAASLYFRPSESLPQLRVGFFQPTLGTKYDDHTILTRNTPSSRSYMPVIPDDYAEWGAQIDYETIEWLGLSVGAFKADNLAVFPATVKKDQGTYDTKREVVQKSIVDSGSVSMVGRLFFTPKLPWNMVGFFGGMGLLNSDFYYTSVFANFGISDKYAVMTEMAYSKKKDGRLTIAYLAEFNYYLLESLIPFFRAEHAIGREVDASKSYRLNTFTVGAHAILLPSVDLLAEYRYFQNEMLPSYMTQWAIQLHLYY
ncbi:MAG: hypothetical protein HW421_963 [Ignavibacteria bacterium]|nr:hypothetical protein [Ignavibacteria bacterium]